MRKIKHIKVEVAILIAIMLMSLMSMLYFGHQKSGYHVDEVYSYGLANSEYLPFMHFGENDYDVKDWMLEYGAGESFADFFRNIGKDIKILQECNFQIYNSAIYQDYLIAQANSADTKTTTWVSGEDYLHYIAASPENTFNYASVYYNQRGDVHPPFFYMLLHTVCSVFQGTFSKWYGMGINIVFMLLTLVVLYKMCSKYLGGKLLGLCVVAAYGLSCGYVSTAVFIRMYAILTFMIVSACYLHLELAKDDFRITKKRGWKLAAITFLGFFTHYYFVLYAIAMAVVVCVWMICKKHFKKMLQYIFLMMGTGALGICVWPFAIRHVFGGYRGMSAVKASLSGGAYGLKTKIMLDQIWPQIIGGHWWIFVVVAVLFAGALILCKKKDIPVGKMVMVIAPIMFYVVATAQIVPFYTERYVMCSYPFWFIVLVGCVYQSVRMICKRFGKKEGERSECLGIIVTIAGTVIFVLLSNCYTNSVGYLFPNEQETVQIPANTDCVYVLPDGDWNESAGDSTILAQCRKVGLVYESNLPVLQSGYQYEDGDYLLLCVQKNMNIEEVAAKVHEMFGTKELREVSRTYGSGAVRILYTK